MAKVNQVKSSKLSVEQTNESLSIVGAFPLKGKDVDDVPLTSMLAVADAAAGKGYPLIIDVLVGVFRVGPPSRKGATQPEIQALTHAQVVGTVKVTTREDMRTLLDRVRLTKFMQIKAAPPIVQLKKTDRLHFPEAEPTQVVGMRLTPQI
jgi:hypothetical protein